MQAALISVFQLLSWATVMPLLEAMVSHWSPDLILWKRSHFGAILGIVGELLGVGAGVVVVEDCVVGDSMVVDWNVEGWVVVEVPVVVVWVCEVTGWWSHQESTRRARSTTCRPRGQGRQHPG